MVTANRLKGPRGRGRARFSATGGGEPTGPSRTGAAAPAAAAPAAPAPAAVAPRKLLRGGLLLALLIAACAAPGPRAPGSVEFGDWRALPVGWERLERIDRWLGQDGLRAPSAERLQATLELAEGRVELTLRDGSSLALETRRTRLELAETGFEQVVSDSLASAEQVERASAGLQAVDRLAQRPAGPVARTDRATGPKRPDLPSGVLPRSSWGAAPAGSNITAASGRWRRITLHHSAMTALPLVRGGLAASASELRGIQRIHQQDQDWADIGYHFLIDPAGRVFEGRELRWQGAHAGSDSSSGRNNNPDNIGVCLLGNFEVERPTPAALASLTQLLEQLRTRYQIPRSELHGHRHFKATECPGAHLASWLANYKAGRVASSSSASNEIAGAKPSAESFSGSPISSSASPDLARPGSTRVR
jgi:hypothetical protein